MPAFTGQLRSNEIFSGIYNMIISQHVFTNNIAGGFPELVEKARVDGGLYGDAKLFYSTDVLGSEPWGADGEALNLLELHRPEDPKCQEIVLDVFRQIPLTIDYYLSKRAWSTEGAFMSFTSVMLGWIRDTKRVYDQTLYNAFIGTSVTNVGKQFREVQIDAAVGAATGEEANRLEAECIAQHIADLIVDMKDVTRDFNDYGHLRSFNENDIMIIWNSKFVNKIRSVDLPTIFHNENLIKKFADNVLPARYFGYVCDSSLVAEGSELEGNKVHSGGDLRPVRSLVEKKITVGGVKKHLFPGDILPNNTTVGGSTAQYKYAECYVEVDDVIAKVVTQLPPFMSAFEVGTTFFNPKSLTENHYLTWGHNTLEYLKGKPMITLVKD